MAVEIRIPRLGWSMEEGTFAGWLKQPGDAVRPNEPLFTLEGEKATQEIESIGEGLLHLAPDSPSRTGGAGGAADRAIVRRWRNAGVE